MDLPEEIKKIFESKDYASIDDKIQDLLSHKASNNKSIKDLAEVIIAHSLARDLTYQHYDEVFDIECEMRDYSYVLAELILEKQNET
jgi:hypothetical protein